MGACIDCASKGDCCKELPLFIVIEGFCTPEATVIDYSNVK